MYISIYIYIYVQSTPKRTVHAHTHSHSHTTTQAQAQSEDIHIIHSYNRTNSHPYIISIEYTKYTHRAQAEERKKSRAHIVYYTIVYTESVCWREFIKQRANEPNNYKCTNLINNYLLFLYSSVLLDSRSLFYAPSVAFIVTNNIDYVQYTY